MCAEGKLVEANFHLETADAVSRVQPGAPQAAERWTSPMCAEGKLLDVNFHLDTGDATSRV